MSNQHHYNKLHSKLLGIVLALATIGISARAVYGLGLSPVDIIADDILPNSSVTKEFYISRGDASAEEIAVVTVEGTAAPYITLPLGSPVTLPAGEQAFVYPLVIEPGALASGTYVAKVTVATGKPTAALTAGGEGSVSAGTNILTGAQLTLTFTITNQTLEQYTITSVEMASSEENQLVGFSYSMSNTGNVDTRPAKIEFTVVDELDPTNTYSETILGDRLTIVPAFTDQVVTVATKAQLVAGLYAIQLTFYNAAGEIVFMNDALRLQIFPEGTLAQKGELIEFATDKATYQVAEPVVLTASFKNTGTVGINASLVVEIMNDGTRLDILKNEPVFVPVGQTANMEQSFKPTEGGTYTAVGYVNYGIFTTDKTEANFTVEALSNISVAVFIGFILLAAGSITFWVYHRKRKKKI